MNPLLASLLLPDQAPILTSQSPELDVATLYRQYAPLVLRRVRRFVGPQEAEEVVHEVFLRAIEKLDTFRAESSPVTWLYSLTTRHCLNRLRDSGRRRELLAERAHDIPMPRPPAPSSETTLFINQLWQTLDPELASIGTHYFVDGLTHDEIARICGCSPRTIGNRIKKIQELARAARQPVEREDRSDPS